MKSVLDHLKDLTGESYSEFDYSSLYKRYAKDIQASKIRDNHIQASRFSDSQELTAGDVRWMQKVVAQELEGEYEKVNGALPVAPVFDTYQASKRAAKDMPRDIGVRVLVTHLEKIWNKDRTASINYEDFLKLKDHYHSSYPKSAACDVLDDAVKNGYVDLDMAKLMEISASIKSQDDYENQIRINGYSSNSPRNKKARQFILSAINGKQAQYDDNTIGKIKDLMGRAREEFGGVRNISYLEPAYHASIAGRPSGWDAMAAQIDGTNLIIGKASWDFDEYDEEHEEVDDSSDYPWDDGGDELYDTEVFDLSDSDEAQEAFEQLISYMDPISGTKQAQYDDDETEELVKSWGPGKRRNIMDQLGDPNTDIENMSYDETEEDIDEEIESVVNSWSPEQKQQVQEYLEVMGSQKKAQYDDDDDFDEYDPQVLVESFINGNRKTVVEKIKESGNPSLLTDVMMALNEYDPEAAGVLDRLYKGASKRRARSVVGQRRN